MEGSNRSGIQCYDHPNQEVTNYCLHFDCLKPLCPDCVQTHTKQHQKQQIQSWKHCVNKSAKSVKSTLDYLRGIFEVQNKYQGFKSLEMIETQNIKKLYHLKDKIIKQTNQVFDSLEQKLRVLIRNHYKIDPPDTTKLKMAMDQLEKILMKLGHTTTVLPALKKSLLLDHQSLINYFGDIKNNDKKVPLAQVYFQENVEITQKFKQILESCAIIGHNAPGCPSPDSYENYKSPNPQRMHTFENRKSVDEGSPFLPLKITEPDYFVSDCKFKFLHFFIPDSKQLKILHVDHVEKGEDWRSVQFHADHNLPRYFKSIITPKGQFYLIGGSEQSTSKRFKQIYKYNHQKNSLDLVCRMINDRSSHAICYVNNSIYIIGGFTKKDGAVSRECQVFRINKQSCQSIAPLNTPSANSCATAFKNEYIFKFGGVEDRIQGNELIEMYSISSNRWIVVDIETPRNIPRLELLSFSAAAQINDKQILVFGGYNDADMQKPQRICYALVVNTNRGAVSVKNYNTTPLTYAEGFWNNNPIIHNKKLYALQNITDQSDELTALADRRRVVMFTGQRWL